MRYSKSLHYLNSFLNLEKVHKPHSRIWNLKRMRALLKQFGHPEKGLFTVVIGGTKGKGSTGYFLQEILRQSGLRAGFYHSPHLEEPRERIWIDGKPVSREDFSKGLSVIARSVATKQSVFGDCLVPPKNSGGSRNDGGGTAATYFEILTLLACLLFKEHKVDLAVFEVGMGGRLDATHVLPAKLVILTPIHFDHEAFLGNTLAQIAKEKAALLRPGQDAVVAPQEPEVRHVIEGMARKRNCPLWPPLKIRGIRTRLLGDFQKLNASVAMRAATLLQSRFRFPVTDRALSKGIQSNHWPGRMELFKGRPSILLDGAHNPKSIEALSRNLKRLFPRQRKIVIFGTSRDKRSDRMLPFLSRVSDICILTRSQTSRSKEISTLVREARNHFRFLIPVESSEEALKLAKKMARPNDLIVGTGSFYLIGELRSLCRR